MRISKRAVGSLVVVFILGLAGAALIVTQVEELRWRAQVVFKKASGGLDAASWADLLSMLKPGSDYWLKPVAEGFGLHATIRNPYGAEADVEEGGRVFRSGCSSCHDGHGGAGVPDLSRSEFKHGASDWALFNTIRQGVPGTAMIPSGLDERAIWQVVAYIRALAEGNSEVSSPVALNAAQWLSVTADRLRNSASEPENWLTYSGAYEGTRYSALDHIDRSNVASLSVEWVLQLPTEELHSESTPLVAGELMFVTVSPNRDLAVSASTGRMVWNKQRPLPEKLTNCCGPHNRGVAVLGDRVYRGTLDGYLIARDAMTGELLWEVEVGAAERGFSITAAPLALEDIVVTGVAGGEYGIRGYLDAYDAASGERRWRIYTIPGPGNPDNSTWEGDSWKVGGGPTWMTGSFDPTLRLIYWGVGNPAPDFNGDEREGDNLYTNSVIAVDVDTGELRWHYQFTPHDLHDWDSNQVPVLIDKVVDGRKRRLLLSGNKNGFGYVLDRETGEFLTAHELVPQTWLESFDANGRPTRKPESEPTNRGTIVRPGTTGGVNWWPPSYNPLSGLVHYSVLESENVFFKDESEFEEGKLFVAGAGQRTSGELHYPAVKAFRAGTGEMAWEYRLPPRSDWPQVGGSLTTAGKLVFFGDKDYFFALDAESGEEVWRMNLGASIHAAPITYMSGGEQMIAIAAGRSLYALSLRR